MSLAAENAALRERIAELEYALGITALEPPRAIVEMPYRRKVRQLLGMLIVCPRLTKEAIYIGLYGDRPDYEQPSIKVVDTYLCYARQYLRGFDVPLQRGVLGESGYWYLSAKDRTTLGALFGIAPASCKRVAA